jgi:hypothetical protein
MAFERVFDLTVAARGDHQRRGAWPAAGRLKIQLR